MLRLIVESSELVFDTSILLRLLPSSFTRDINFSCDARIEASFFLFFFLWILTITDILIYSRMSHGWKNHILTEFFFFFFVTCVVFSADFRLRISENALRSSFDGSKVSYLSTLSRSSHITSHSARTAQNHQKLNFSTIGKMYEDTFCLFLEESREQFLLLHLYHLAMKLGSPFFFLIISVRLSRFLSDFCQNASWIWLKKATPTFFSSTNSKRHATLSVFFFYADMRPTFFSKLMKNFDEELMKNFTLASSVNEPIFRAQMKCTISLLNRSKLKSGSKYITYTTSKNIVRWAAFFGTGA